MSACRVRRVDSGFALVIVLWATVLLSVIAASFAFSMRTETRLAGNLVERAQAGAIADAGIRRGIVALLAGPKASHWVADGRAYELAFGEGTMRVRLFSENGKVDLNGAPEPLIHGLLEALATSSDLADPQQASAIADAILDWRDPDQSVRPMGAEDRTYTAAGRAIRARDGAFLSVSELSDVLGVDAATYAKLEPLVTVYSWAPQVDPMSASRTVLLAIPGLDEERVDQFLAARDAFYADQLADGEEVPRLPLELLSPGARYLSRSKARVYVVEAEGELADRALVRRRAVVQLTGDRRRPYSILAWDDSQRDAREIAPSDSGS